MFRPGEFVGLRPGGCSTEVLAGREFLQAKEKVGLQCQK